MQQEKYSFIVINNYKSANFCEFLKGRNNNIKSFRFDLTSMLKLLLLVKELSIISNISVFTEAHFQRFIKILVSSFTFSIIA